MTETLTVRFLEYERYDIERDSQVVRFMAMTNDGSYTSEVPVVSPKDIRESREAFKQYVLQAMALGQPPHEVYISDSPREIG